MLRRGYSLKANSSSDTNNSTSPDESHTSNDAESAWHRGSKRAHGVAGIDSWLLIGCPLVYYCDVILTVLLFTVWHHLFTHDVTKPSLIHRNVYVDDVTDDIIRTTYPLHMAYNVMYIYMYNIHAWHICMTYMYDIYAWHTRMPYMHNIHAWHTCIAYMFANTHDINAYQVCMTYMHNIIHDIHAWCTCMKYMHDSHV